jgi:hypothetical protein
MPPSFFLHRPDIENFVLVYTMGKVASVPLMRSLEAVDIYCRHLHWVTPDTQAFFERLEQVSPTRLTHWNFYVQNRLNMRQGRSALQDAEYAPLIKVITAIRAPIEQILSHYFQACPVFASALKMRKLEFTAANVRDAIADGVELYMTNPARTIDDLTRDLTEQNCDKILFCWLVHNYLHWFDEEFRPFFSDGYSGRLAQRRIPDRGQCVDLEVRRLVAARRASRRRLCQAPPLQIASRQYRSAERLRRCVWRSR